MTVAQSGGDYSVIQEAIDACANGMTVQIENGTYAEHLTVNKQITLTAKPGHTPTIDGSDSQTPAITVTAAATLRGLTINGAHALGAASSQYWSIADNAALSMGDIDFTVCAWVYLDTKVSARPVCGKGDYSLAKNAEYQLEYSSGVDRLRFTVGNGTTSGSVDANNLGSPSTATWYCVIAWHDATANTINISVNDGTTNSASYSGGSQNTAGHFVIGTFATYLTNYFNGRIDNVAIAKSVLTAAQRTAFYNAGVGTETLT